MTLFIAAFLCCVCVWWGGRWPTLDQKPFMLNWAIVYLEKQKEGLSVKNLSIFNEALFQKMFLNICKRMKSSLERGNCRKV